MRSKGETGRPAIRLGDAATAISRESLTSAVAKALREKILQGELGEGQQLRQHEIAQELRVSRTPVREALRQLEAEGLIKIVDHYGAVVAALSFEEVKELFEIRAVLESHVLRYAIPHLTDGELARAGMIMAEFESALNRDADIGTWGDLNLQFHLALYGAANRPRFISLIQAIHNRSDRYVRIHLRQAEERVVTIEEHRKILELCRCCDVDQACALAQDHIMKAGQSLVEYLQPGRRE